MNNIDLIEKLNREVVELKNSKEYTIGRKVIKFIDAIKHGNILKLIQALKLKTIDKRVPVKKNRKLYYMQGKDLEARGVVYTCITGEYDLPKEVLYDDEKLDYFLFTDNSLNEYLGKWNVSSVTNIGFYGKGNLINRFCKMNPFILFSDKKYDFAIYIDGNVQIVSNVSRLYSLAKQSNLGIAVHRHFARDCIYDEAVACNLSKKGNKEFIIRQMQKYKQDGFPSHFGLYEATIIVVDLHNKHAKKVLEFWWKEYLDSQSMRDQLALPYVIWKNGFNFNDIGDLGNNLYKNPKFRIYLHK